ncbi:MAG: hypothetical protein A3G33_11180 [Omnitrophica bacterium RIFCSPLOWO2_12_FULL_44_17]|uniref:FecR protein domain-containing protein n=1 Tax=Candidatus Danuiimicrobium aquiferis TaxID=1801832 RepID=A0A1G1KRH0_9BACT|nr:MAG: hypothetical protein A3G33_11180 [Omnitrophica bacterium RIFCSPLOWO2_12_FULL_44_17]
MKLKFSHSFFLMVAILTASPLLFAATFALEDVNGTVQVLKAGQTAWIPAKNGMALEPGDTIKTESSSKAKLKMTNGEIRLDEKTNFRVKEFTIKDEEIQASLELTIGQLKANIDKMKKGSLMQFRTPTSVASVRGTGLGLLVYLFEGEIFSRLDVFEGIVGFSDLNGEHEHNVEAGEHSTGDEEGTTTPEDNTEDGTGTENEPGTLSEGLEPQPGFQQNTPGSLDNASGNPNEETSSESSYEPPPEEEG